MTAEDSTVSLPADTRPATVNAKLQTIPSINL